MRSWFAVVLSAASLVGLAAACGETTPLDDLPCPCALGYACCATTNLCLPNGAACETAGDAGPAEDAAAVEDAALAECPPPIGAAVVVHRTLDPTSWSATGTNPAAYAFGSDPAAVLGYHDIHVVSNDAATPSGNATYFGLLVADPYRGRKLRYSARVTSAGTTGSGGMWMGVPAADGGFLAFDNMLNRPLKGDLAAAKYEVVLDVAAEATRIDLGLLLFGTGDLALTDPALEIVEPGAPYVEDPSAWLVGGEDVDAFTLALAKAGHDCGDVVATLSSATASKSKSAIAWQDVAGSAYRGKRVRLSGYVRSSMPAGLWMRLQDGTGKVVAGDDTAPRARANAGWTKTEVVLDVPVETVDLAFGLRATGAGAAAMSGVMLEVVDGAVPTTPP